MQPKLVRDPPHSAAPLQTSASTLSAYPLKPVKSLKCTCRIAESLSAGAWKARRNPASRVAKASNCPESSRARRGAARYLPGPALNLVIRALCSHVDSLLPSPRCRRRSPRLRPLRRFGQWSLLLLSLPLAPIPSYRNDTMARFKAFFTVLIFCYQLLSECLVYHASDRCDLIFS